MAGEVFSGTITSDDILGKDVIDIDNAFIGVVEKLHLTLDVEVVGITIDRGFLKKGFSIGKSYIKRVTPHAIFLKIRPSFFIKGMAVFDSRGVNVGRVDDVLLQGNTNNLKSITLHKGFKSFTLSSSLIDSIGEGVFLKIKEKDLRGNNLS